VSVCFDRVKPLVDETVRRLGIKSFPDDPIAGRRYARATSIVSSAYKRHGKILEAATFEHLRDNNRLSVWSDPTFAISGAAEGLVHNSTRSDCSRLQRQERNARSLGEGHRLVYGVAGSARDADGMLVSEASTPGDPFHANAWCGAHVLRQIEARTAGTETPTPPGCGKTWGR
jgi:hypothetical protein